ncbi:hypothetical protein JCM6882_004722 [Rhodosporidiobolus microsporus]
MSLDALSKQFEGNIDFVGQDLAEQRVKVVLWAAAAIAFVAGFAVQDLRVTFGIFGVGFLSCLALVVPPLPAYTAHPVKWLNTLDEYGEPMVGSAGAASTVGAGKGQAKR